MTSESILLNNLQTLLVLERELREKCERAGTIAIGDGHVS